LTQSQVSTVVNDPASVDAAIESRFSARAFLPTPVPKALIADILRVASRAPSGVNAQPWKVYVLQGASQASLSRQICTAHDAIYADPAVAASYSEPYDYYPQKWVSPYIDRRRENGWGLYGLLGITKGDACPTSAQLRLL
jgi:nitroreductase